MPRELVATIEAGPDGQREVTVLAERTDGASWRVEIGERWYDVDAREVRPGVWSLVCDGRVVRVDLDRRKQGTAILLGAAEVMVKLEDPRLKKLAQAVVGRAGAGAAGQAEIIRAPIAGKVVKILAAPGDEVEAGRSVCVLEAMKMENDIKAERGGKVTAVHVEAGRSVETGDKLLTLG